MQWNAMKCNEKREKWEKQWPLGVVSLGYHHKQMARDSTQDWKERIKKEKKEQKLNQDGLFTIEFDITMWNKK